MDSTIAPFWLLLTAIICFLALQVAGRVFPQDNPATLAMHTLVLTWSWLVVVSFALSILAMLTWWSLGASVLAAAAISYRLVADRLSTPFQPDRNGTQNDFPHALRWLWVLIACIGVYHAVRNGLCRFPTEWDTLMYHRPLITLWIQTGSLFVPQCAVWHFPGNHELLGLWWAIPFSGDFFVSLMSLTGPLLMGLSVCHFSRLTGLSPVMCSAVTLGTLASSVVFQQCVDSKNDVATAALFFTSITYGVRYIRLQTTGNLIFCGLSAGLLAGTKYYALGYVVIAGSGLFTAAVIVRGPAFSVKALVIAAPFVLITSFYWYARNWVHTGTPVFPLGYSGDFVAEVEGRLDRSLGSTSLLGNGRMELMLQYLSAVGQLGGMRQRLAVLILPLSLCWLLASRMLSGTVLSKECGAIRTSLLVMTFAAWAYFLVTPCTVDMYDELSIHSPLLVVRFSQIPLILSGLSGAIIVSDIVTWLQSCGRPSSLKRAAARFIPGLLLLEALAGYLGRVGEIMTAHLPAMLISTLNAVIVCSILRIWSRSLLPILTAWRARAAVFTVALLLIAGAVAAGTSRHSRWWHSNFSRHYDSMFRTTAYSSFEDEAATQTLMVLQYRYYPFFGSRRQTRVYRPLRSMSCDFLLAYVSLTGTENLVVVDRGNQFELRTGEMMDSWIHEHPGVFLLRHTGSHFRTFHVNHNELKALLAGNSWLQRIPANNLFADYSLQ